MFCYTAVTSQSHIVLNVFSNKMIKWYTQGLNQCSLPKCWMNYVSLMKSCERVSDGLNVFPPEIVKVPLPTVFFCSWTCSNYVNLFMNSSWTSSNFCWPYLNKFKFCFFFEHVHELFMNMFVKRMKLDLKALFIIRVKRELKRVYRNGCRYNERLNAETGVSKTPRIHY